MGSLDVDLLFTNIFLDEAIDICTITIYNQQVVIEIINKHGFQTRNPILFSTKFYMSKRSCNEFSPGPNFSKFRFLFS